MLSWTPVGLKQQYVIRPRIPDISKRTATFEGPRPRPKYSEKKLAHCHAV